MKKLLAALMILTLILALATPAFAAKNDNVELLIGGVTQFTITI